MNSMTGEALRRSWADVVQATKFVHVVFTVVEGRDMRETYAK